MRASGRRAGTERHDGVRRRVFLESSLLLFRLWLAKVQCIHGEHDQLLLIIQLPLQVDPSSVFATFAAAAVAASLPARDGPLATSANATSTASGTAFDASTSTAACCSASDAVLVYHVWLVRQRWPRARANPSRVRDRKDRAGTSPHALCSVRHLRPSVLLSVHGPGIVSVLQLGHDEHGQLQHVQRVHLQASASTLTAAAVHAASPTGDGPAATAALAATATCASATPFTAISSAITASAVAPCTVRANHFWHVHQRWLW